MTAQDLKNSILQRAIQGKLLPQNPDDEKPFDIPDGWQWVHIPDIVFFQEGPGILAKDFRSRGIPLVRISGMKTSTVTLDGCNYLDSDMVEQHWKHFKLDYGDVLISTSASMDKIAEVDEKAVGAIPYTGLIRFKMYGGINKKFFKYFVQSPFYVKQIDEQKTGGVIKHYGPSHLKKMTIPLPPLAEQKRIVEKLEEILPLVERYGELEQRLTKLDKEFPDKLKKSLLQQAIQGKLTRQLSTDGDASDLLEKIRAEKSKLIADGKIKKEKLLPPISAEEIPFDIPENWVWCRLGELYNFIDYRGKTPIKISQGVPLVTAKNVKRGYNDYSIKEYISQEEYDSRQSRGISHKGDILFTTEAPLGHVSIADLDIFSAGQRLITLQAYDSMICNEIMMFFILSEPFQKMLIAHKTGTTVSGIKSDKLKKMLIPVPPLAEQERIVKRLAELLPLCDRLKGEIAE